MVSNHVLPLVTYTEVLELDPPVGRGLQKIIRGSPGKPVSHPLSVSDIDIFIIFNPKCGTILLCYGGVNISSELITGNVHTMK